MLNALDALIRLAPTPRVGPLCAMVLQDPMFQAGIGSSGHHPKSHQVPGGLVIHTLEVAKAAVQMAHPDKKLMELAYVAAVFHDYGKILEYEWTNAGVKKLQFARMTGHVVFGWQFFLTASAKHDVDPDDAADIAHAILAHMGRKLWGSPVEPQTPLAHIIHAADLLSAKGLVKCS